MPTLIPLESVERGASQDESAEDPVAEPPSPTDPIGAAAAPAGELGEETSGGVAARGDTDADGEDQPDPPAVVGAAPRGRKRRRNRR